MQRTELQYPSPRVEYADLTRAELERAIDWLSTNPVSYETSDDDTLKVRVVQPEDGVLEAFEAAVFR